MFRTKGTLLLAGVIVAGAAQAQLIIVNPVFVSGTGALATGSSSLVSGNSVTVSLPNAIVGDSIPGARAGTVFIQYDSVNAAGGNAFFPGISLNFGGNVRGSGQITVTEQIFGLTLVGNTLVESVAPITTASVSFGNNLGVFTHSSVIPSPYFGAGIRVKKLITLEALPDTPGVDLASVSYMNQAVVPEPATMTALGLGAAALMRRRKK